MIRKNFVSGFAAASALAVVSWGAAAQPVNQSVTYGTGVNSNTQYQTRPRSNVTITPGATVYPGTYTTRVESAGPTGGTRNGGAIYQRNTATSTSSAGRSTVIATVTSPATAWSAHDRNVNSPGNGYAKGKVKHEQKHKDKHNKHKHKHKHKHH